MLCLLCLECLPPTSSNPKTHQLPSPASHRIPNTSVPNSHIKNTRRAQNMASLSHHSRKKSEELIRMARSANADGIGRTREADGGGIRRDGLCARVYVLR